MTRAPQKKKPAPKKPAPRKTATEKTPEFPIKLDRFDPVVSDMMQHGNEEMALDEFMNAVFKFQNKIRVANIADRKGFWDEMRKRHNLVRGKQYVFDQNFDFPVIDLKD